MQPVGKVWAIVILLALTSVAPVAFSQDQAKTSSKVFAVGLGTSMDNIFRGSTLNGGSYATTAVPLLLADMWTIQPFVMTQVTPDFAKELLLGGDATLDIRMAWMGDGFLTVGVRYLYDLGDNTHLLGPELTLLSSETTDAERSVRVRFLTLYVLWDFSQIAPVTGGFDMLQVAVFF